MVVSLFWVSKSPRSKSEHTRIHDPVRIETLFPGSPGAAGLLADPGMRGVCAADLKMCGAGGVHCCDQITTQFMDRRSRGWPLGAPAVRRHLIRRTQTTV